MKYQSTERMRRAVNDAMDMHGGRGICDGPVNYLQSAYQMVPVGITVEGANILTRSLITFAQGALRSHPYLYQARSRPARTPTPSAASTPSTRAFGDHVVFSLSNAFGAFFHNITGGLFAPAPEKAYGTAQWYRQLGARSRNFAFVADLTVAVLGGGLKTKQKLTGRLADALSELYLLVVRAEALRGRRQAGRATGTSSRCARATACIHFQEALRGVDRQLPRSAGALADAAWSCFRSARPTSRRRTGSATRPSSWCWMPGEVRDRLTRYIYVSKRSQRSDRRCSR